MLEDAGYGVLDAETAETALTTAAAALPRRIDLLLTDGLMAAMSGQELIQRFRLDHPETAVIYMSGWEPESAPSGMLPEGEVFLAKPFTPETLLETVRSTLDRASAASEP